MAPDSGRSAGASQKVESTTLEAMSSAAKDTSSSMAPATKQKVVKPPTASQIAALEKQYPAFARTDIYGPMGTGGLSILDTLRLWAGGLVLFPLRLVAVVLIIFVYYIICRVTLLGRSSFRRNGRPAAENAVGLRRTIIVETGKRCARAVLFVIGFYHIKKVKRGGGPDGVRSQPRSHCLWLGSLALSRMFKAF